MIVYLRLCCWLVVDMVFVVIVVGVGVLVVGVGLFWGVLRVGKVV